MQRDFGLTRAGALARVAAEQRAEQALDRLRGPLALRPGQAWFDPTAGSLTVAVTDAATADRVRAAGATALVVRFGTARLARVADRIAALGVPAAVTGWGVDAAADRVVVTVDGSRLDAAAGRAVDRVRALGEMVRVRQVSQAPVQHGGDVRGGDKWVPGTEGPCTIGFAVTGSGGSRHFLSAGHCTNDVNQAAYGKDGTRIGTSNVGGNHTVNAMEGDFGLIDVDQAGWTLSPVVTANGVAADVTITGSKDAVVGTAVCHSGTTSKWKCGSVTKVNQTVNYGSFSVGGLTYASTCGQSGDSGGAWVTVSDAKAVGLHEGGYSDSCGQQEAWFQPVNEALAKWNLTLVTGGGGGGDTTAPTVPGNLRATGTTSSSVSLAWDAATDNVGVTGYDVYQGGTLATSVSGTTATVTGLASGTAYTFTVRARDAAGNTSAASGAVTATTQTGGGGTRTFSSTTTVFIPDPGTVDSPVTSTASGSAASSVAVTVTASHFCGQDLRLELVAPNGTVYLLKSASTGACTNYSGGTYTATGVSAPAAGTWKLRVTDTRSWNFGNVSGWSVTL
ncbi:proprotein convertase P-domain-containing protein [Catellatospora sp. NEAU-YM18]|nr:proprotein convertase P-domain-containing protein [Catellatospora tritici]